MGEGFGADGLADPGPHGGQLNGDVAVAVDEVVSLDSEQHEARQVGVGLGENKLLGGADLGEGEGVTASQVTHPVVPGLVGGSGDEPSQVPATGEHAGVAAQ